MIKSLKIAFIGLSHLSLNYIIAASEKNFKVTGFDKDKEIIDKLKSNTKIYDEPKLSEYLKKNKHKINFSSNFNDLKKFDLIFLGKDVKTNSNGKSDLTEINKLLKLSIPKISKKALLIVLSQIPPGFMRKIKFEKSRLYYQVETLIFGNSIKRALKPERIIVGSIDKEQKIKKNFQMFLKKFKCPIINMKYESAELTKIAINIYLASSITTTNVLSKVCEKIDANWLDIIPALKLDKRIGKNAYVYPGLGISGGNIERDIFAIRKILKKENVFNLLPDSFDKISSLMRLWIFRLLKKNNFIKKNIKLGILGLAYKAKTNSIKNSVAIELIKKLPNDISVYDPKVKLEKKINRYKQTNNVEEIYKKSKIIIIATPWLQFKSISNHLSTLRKNKTVIIDPYNLLNSNQFLQSKIKYFSIGRNVN
jgi:UDPglucose 6-dehydrogenase